MTQIIRSAKSGSGWTNNELVGLNIEVQDVDTLTFFNTPELPPSRVSPVILNNVEMPQGPLAKTDRLFFHYLRDAIQLKGEESTVGDFAAFILGMFDYDEQDRIIHQRKELSFVMCGERVDAKPDVCVVSFTDFLLLVQPQLIAAAIAAFYQNNLTRTRSRRPSLTFKVFAGITMIDAVPIFYRIPVSAGLLRCIEAGTYPPQATFVQRFVPPVPSPALYMANGLVSLENRRVVMQCFEAFKVFVTED